MIKTLLFWLIGIMSLGYGHQDYKSIEKGMIHAKGCPEAKKIEELIACGRKYYIESPKRRYEIIEIDSGKIQLFLKKRRTRRVRITLKIESREGDFELWKVLKISKR